MNRLSYIVLACVLFCGVSQADADELFAGVGIGPNSLMQMKFEVTFMKIDVAFIDVQLVEDTVARILPHVEGQKYKKKKAETIGSLLLDEDTLLIRMRYLRDADLEKFLKGIRKGLEGAAKDEIITDAEFAVVWPRLEADLLVLQDRGGKKDDELIYRIDGDRLRMVFRSADQDALVDMSYIGSEWVRGIKGSFFGKESKFRKKLVRSLFDQPDQF